MKTCPKCGLQLADEATFCAQCGASLADVPAVAAQPAYQQTASAGAENYPTPEYQLDKICGIFGAFGGIIGVLLAYFGGEVDGKRSEYVRFYANEGLVFTLSYLLAVIPFVGWAWSLFTFVCQIIAVVNACKGIAKPVLFFGTIRLIK